jgi:hypothetical protein
MSLDLKVENNASGSLSAGITAIATSLSLKTGEGAEFPAITGSEYFYATLQKAGGAWEIVKVTAVSGDDFTTIVRNVDSSTGAAQAFSIDDIVSLRPTKQVIDDIITEINSYEESSKGIESGTEVWFHQDIAPTGWTIESGLFDRLLAVKGGTQAYNVNGGNPGGTWTQPNHTHGMAGHVHSTRGHVLSVAEMPVHDHDIKSGAGYQGAGSGFSVLAGSPYTGSWGDPCASAGSGGSHSHGDTYGPSDNTTGGSATANTYRPGANCGIIASKD